MLNMTSVKLEKVIYIDMYLFIEKELRDCTLGMQKGEPVDFCGGHKIFQAYIDGP